MRVCLPKYPPFRGDSEFNLIRDSVGPTSPHPKRNLVFAGSPMSLALKCTREQTNRPTDNATSVTTGRACNTGACDAA